MPLKSRHGRHQEAREGGRFSVTYQVRWLQGGRGGSWEDEKFADEDQAEDFRKLVEAHGNKWPYSWVKGRGFVEPEEHPNDVPLVAYAHEYVDELTTVDVRTSEDYHREIDRHFSLIVHKRTDGDEIPATICNLTQRDVNNWMRVEQEGEPDPSDGTKWLRKKADPKSIRNRHGLLYCVVQAAVDATPQPRSPTAARRPYRDGSACRPGRLR
ncbi:hypothetical protein [Streptomyces acidicola]|uniref:hypothetical protein n=1 Tax=Streptomyces acidicola TaxID=2596892 RepID=UPI003803E46B